MGTLTYDINSNKNMTVTKKNLYRFCFIILIGVSIVDCRARHDRTKRQQALLPATAICSSGLLKCLIYLSKTIPFRYQFDMVDVYDRVTGRNDERKTLETRVAKLGVEEAEHKSEGIDGDFKLRERVTRKRMELAAVRHAVRMKRLTDIRKKILRMR